MTKPARVLSCIVLVSGLSAQALRATSPQEQKMLQAVTTIATKLPTTIEQAPGNTTIIDKRDITIRPNYRFTDTLRGYEGVLQPKGRGLETFDGAMIRGISNGALLMVDGVVLNDINNNTKMLTAMRAHDLERVEITRGASSALYGSGALSGAINFTTAMPDSLAVYGSLGYGNPFSANGAPENLTNWYLSVGDSFFNKALRIKATYGGSFSSGYGADSAWVNASGDNGINGLSGALPSHKTDGTPILIVGDMGHQRYATHDARIKAQADIGLSGVLDAWVQYSNYNYIHHRQQSFLRDELGGVAWGDKTSGFVDSNASGSAPYAYVGGMGNERYNQVISALSYKHYFGDNLWHTSLNHTYGNDIWAGPSSGASPFGGAGSKQDHHYNTLNFETYFTLRFSQHHSLLFGAQERLSSYKQNAYNLSDWRDFLSTTALTKTITGTHNFLGAFLHYQGQFSKYLSVGLSGRWDLWQGFNYTDTTKPNAPNATHNQFSPKFSLNFTPFSNEYATTIIKASGGSSFRAPTFSQKFRDYVRNDGVQTSGNPNLKPEELYSYDVGLEQAIFLESGLESNFSAQLKLYYFDSFFTNAITTIGKNLENAQRARINGIELSYRQKLFGYGGLFASYTFYNAKLTQDLVSGSQVIAAGNRLPGVPEHSGYVQLYYDDGKAFGSLGCEMASKRYKDLDNASQKVWGVYSSSDAYYLLDMRLGYRMKHLELSANLTNLLDYKYYSYYRAPGRAFYLEIASRF